MMVLEIMFWFSVFLLFYTYMLYPFLLRLLRRRKKVNDIIYDKEEDIPPVSIIIAAYNEEKVIVEKIDSIYNSNFPFSKMEVLIGSDASTDSTNTIIQKLQKKYKNLHLTVFKVRKGKGNILNELVSKAKYPLLILTDANVMFDKSTVYELLKHFKNHKIGLVDAHMVNKKIKKRGISYQERYYIEWEVFNKNSEGIIWGTMMGPFGGCYALRKELFVPVPHNFIVDDFYINMKVLEKDYHAINDLNAYCYEDASHKIMEEFRRKVRISAGNFQNLMYFFHLLFSNIRGLSFSFLSHKVLRWLGPFLIISIYVSCLLLSFGNPYYIVLLYILSGMFLMIFVDVFIEKIGINSVILRFITHFYVMNLALLLGFFKYLKGIKTNVWEPTKRHQ